MKKKITLQNILIFLLSLVVIYRFTFMTAEKREEELQITSTVDGDGFLNYVLLRPWIDEPHDLSYWHINKHFDSFSELNFNASHMYAGDCNTLGVFSQDNLTDAQTNTLKSIFRESEQNGLRCILGRSRIELSCLSQRIIYEIENGNNHLTTNYGFVYRNNMTDDSISVYGIDDNRTVLMPKAGIHSAGWLCDSIYENLQHTDLYYFHYGTDTTNWKIKPVMKINPDDYEPGDPTPVISIVVTNYIGEIISVDTIRVGNFAQNNYSGDYIQDFFSIDLSISGKDSINGLSHGRPPDGWNIDSCKVDFKVYWFGLVDVWFDKMIVDDMRADQLFQGNYDVKIQNEINILKDSVIHFVGEITSSQAHATEYVKNKIKDYYATAMLQFAVSNNLNMYNHRNDNTGAKMLFDIVKPELMCLDAHVFQMDSGYQIYLPNNMNNYDTRVPNSWKASPTVYNDRLQTNALGNKNELVTPYQGTFIYQIAKYRNDLRNLSYSTKFVVQPHLHSWTKTTNNVFTEYNAAFREPTNEEIQAQATIAIAHGVQSLNWECYHSEYSNNFNFYEPGTILNNTVYTILGLRNDDSTKRTSNIVYQDKWEYVKAMNLKILHWKPTLDQVKWDSGYSVHYEGANYNFISDIKSIIVNPESPLRCVQDSINYDCAEERYWEMGFFKPDFENPDVSANDKSKYFMMVNRRCVPNINNDGDLRQLKIKFNSSQLAGFNNWKIIDLDSNKMVRTFDKDSNIYVDMGVYISTVSLT